MRIVLFSLVLLCSSIQMLSQERQDKIHQRIESKKIAYLSDKLDLSSEEAQVFWPLYNDYHDELRLTRKPLIKEHQEDISDDAATKLLNVHLESQQAELHTKVKFVERFKNTIGPKKTLMLWRYERKFKEDLLKRARHGRSRRG